MVLNTFYAAKWAGKYKEIIIQNQGKIYVKISYFNTRSKLILNI